MIKFTATLPDGRRLVGLGLSRANCERLLADQPIVVDTQIQLGLPWRGEILLFAGESEAALVRRLDELGVVGPETVIHRETP